jgi:DNA-directed RNA polymerase III subunit RPC3
MWPREAAFFAASAHFSTAANIIRDDFGPVVEKVCTHLLSHGTKTLPEVGRGVELSPSQVRNALLVLIQQNIVRSIARAAPGPPAGQHRRPGAEAPPNTVLYEASLDEILVRRWFPRMLLHVREHVGKDAELVLQELLMSGRLTTEQLHRRAVASVAASSKLADDSPEVDAKRMELSTLIRQMCASRYIVPSETLPESLADEDALGVVDNSAPSLLPAPSSAGSSRKRKASSRAEATPAVGSFSGAGQLLGVVRGEVEGGGVGRAGGDLMRVSISRFLTDFRHVAIQRLIGDKLDANAEGLVEVALNLQRTAGSASQAYLLDEAPSYRDPFTIDHLLSQCPERFSANGPPISRQLVRNYLDALCSDPLCKVASTLNDKYMLELPELCNCVKQLVLEGVVRSKHGDAACRLYRLLLRGHSNGSCSARGQQRYELKQISELALLPERDTRPLLWQLLQSAYVQLQEVPRSADRNPKTTTFLWYADLASAYRTLETELFATITTLHARVEAEKRTGGVSGSAGGNASSCGASWIAPGSLEEPRRDDPTTRARVEGLQASILGLLDTALLLRMM